jgi:adenine-specific DNA-methyltransferase
MIRPKNDMPRVAPKVLTAFLNSEIVDRAFRCLSGSVAVSAYELEALPLPAPDSLAPLTERVTDGASREELEEVCARLFFAGEGA